MSLFITSRFSKDNKWLLRKLNDDAWNINIVLDRLPFWKCGAFNARNNTQSLKRNFPYLQSRESKCLSLYLLLSFFELWRLSKDVFGSNSVWVLSRFRFSKSTFALLLMSYWGHTYFIGEFSWRQNWFSWLCCPWKFL